MTIRLSTLSPFAQGGNRLCFMHPEYSDRCIKVRRPDFTLEDLRRKKGFPKNLRPLSSFDDNREESLVMTQIAKHIGEDVFELVSRCYGFEETDMGNGLTSELILNADGRISKTLKQHLWDEGYTNELQCAVQMFGNRWTELGIPSRDLLVHNIVVQSNQDMSIKRLVVIDGLGSPNLLPFYWMTRSSQQARAKRKVENLAERIQELLKARKQGKFPGTHGLLFHDGNSVITNTKDH